MDDGRLRWRLLRRQHHAGPLHLHAYPVKLVRTIPNMKTRLADMVGPGPWTSRAR